jgi:hypothetical protein
MMMVMMTTHRTMMRTNRHKRKADKRLIDYFQTPPRYFSNQWVK